MTPTTAIPTPEQVAGDPALFAETWLWILDKQKRKRRLIYNAAQRDYLKNRTKRDLILKARQLGFSTAIQAEFYRLATTRHASTLTLAHDDKLTQRLRRMADFFHENIEPEEFRPKRKYANASVTTYPGMHSEVAIGTAGNLSIGRGDTFTHFHGTEAAFWADAESIVAGAGQAGDPAIVLESTANGAQGYFYDECMAALDGTSEYRLHFYPWWWDPAYREPLGPGEVLEYSDEEVKLIAEHGLTAEQIKWRRVKQAELKHLFLQEYAEDPITCFLLSGTGYFGDISQCFRAPLGAEPVEGHRYFSALDFGQTVDFTVHLIIDQTTGEMVFMRRMNHLPWAEMRRRVTEDCLKWGIEMIVPESNSMGSTNIEELHREFAEAGCETTIWPFETTNISKAGVMADLHEALHSGALSLQDIGVLKQELRIFQASQTATGLWRLAAPEKKHDDTVITLALAWHACQHGRRMGGIHV